PRYVWLKNATNLSAGQRETLVSLTDSNLKTARAYQIRLTFQEFYQQGSRPQGEAFLKRWYFWATHNRLPPMVEAALTIRRHWNGILRQRHPGRHQQPRPGGQSEGTRI